MPLIRITSLPPEGLVIAEDLDLQAINARLSENGSSHGIQCTRAPKVAITVSPALGEAAQASGTIKVFYTQPCGRCLEEIEQQGEVSVELLIKLKPPVSPELSAEERDERYFDDVGLLYYEGDQVDLENYLQESIILSFTPHWSPACSDDGDCALCGKSYLKAAGLVHLGEQEPETTNLGALLKAAQEKKRKKVH